MHSPTIPNLPLQPRRKENRRDKIDICSQPKEQRTSFCIGVEIAGVALKSCFPREKRE
jgi:hypothetical protein